MHQALRPPAGCRSTNCSKSRGCIHTHCQRADYPPGSLLNLKRSCTAIQLTGSVGEEKPACSTAQAARRSADCFGVPCSGKLTTQQWHQLLCLYRGSLAQDQAHLETHRLNRFGNPFAQAGGSGPVSLFSLRLKISSSGNPDAHEAGSVPDRPHLVSFLRQTQPRPSRVGQGKRGC